jgi:hypothetical protein
MGNKATVARRIAAGLPAKGKLLADLSGVSAEDRARAGITDEMANAMASSNQPQPKGVQVHKGPWQESEDHDVVTQVRVIDHDNNIVLWSGTEEQFTALKKAIKKG